MTDDNPDSELILSELARVLLSSGFINSRGCTRFLSHIVRASLDGRSKDLSEYALGVDVFGKSDAFDPRMDSVVRVYATKVRKKLCMYYGTEGQLDPVRIMLPPGTYVPVFSAATDKHSMQLVSTNRDELYVGVFPICLGNSSAVNDLCVRIADELISKLAGVAGIRVLAGAYTLLANQNHSVAGASALGVNAIIEITTRHSKDEVRVQTRLFDLRTGYIIWKSRVSSDEMSADEESIANQIALGVISGLKVNLLNSTEIERSWKSVAR